MERKSLGGLQRSTRLKDRIDHEIREHGRTWCSESCQTFLPTVYRQLRQDGCSREEVQSRYDSCHAVR